MANISNAFGTIHLKGKWTASMLKNFNIINEQWADYYYCTSADPFSEGELSQPFVGSGRWAYLNNLEMAANWCVSENNACTTKALLDLIEAMRQNHDSRIEFEYTEDEPGCQFLQTVNAKLRPVPFSPVSHILRRENKIYLRVGEFKIHLPDDFEDKDIDKILELTPDGAKYKLNLPEYHFTAMTILDDKKLSLTEEDGKQVIRSGFAEIVFEDAGQAALIQGRIGEKDDCSITFTEKDISVYFPAYTLKCVVLENTDYEYTAEKLVELDVWESAESVFEDILCNFDLEDYEENEIKYLREYLGKYYSDFLAYALERDKNLTVERLAAKGF
ncbi:hypothetical protein AGMMS49975_14750 [Clostridia bacterium]|nr:hypothetical protein AGMMS49975_14750 [Clostridia bacterium]